MSVNVDLKFEAILENIKTIFDAPRYSGTMRGKGLIHTCNCCGYKFAVYRVAKNS